MVKLRDFIVYEEIISFILHLLRLNFRRVFFIINIEDGIFPRIQL